MSEALTREMIEQAAERMIEAYSEPSPAIVLSPAAHHEMRVWWRKEEIYARLVQDTEKRLAFEAGYKAAMGKRKVLETTIKRRWQQHCMALARGQALLEIPK